MTTLDALFCGIAGVVAFGACATFFPLAQSAAMTLCGVWLFQKGLLLIQEGRGDIVIYWFPLMMMAGAVIATHLHRPEPVWQGLSWETVGSYLQSKDDFHYFILAVWLVLHIVTGVLALVIAVPIWKWARQRSIWFSDLVLTGGGLAAIEAGWHATGPIFLALYLVLLIRHSSSRRIAKTATVEEQNETGSEAY
jgi:hypothetical protein